MAKKDTYTTGNAGTEQNSSTDTSSLRENNHSMNDEVEQTEIKNAHASGTGSMGRNDEPIDDNASKDSSDY